MFVCGPAAPGQNNVPYEDRLRARRLKSITQGYCITSVVSLVPCFVPDSWWCQHFQRKTVSSKQFEYPSQKIRVLILTSQRWIYAVKQNCWQNWIFSLSMEISQVWGFCVCLFLIPAKFLISKTPWRNELPFLITYPVKKYSFISIFHHLSILIKCPLLLALWGRVNKSFWSLNYVFSSAYSFQLLQSTLGGQQPFLFCSFALGCFNNNFQIHFLTTVAFSPHFLCRLPHTHSFRPASVTLHVCHLQLHLSQWSVTL